MMANETEGLLDTLCRRCGCAYLSDLPELATRDELHQVLSGINIDAWTLREWQEAATYLTRQSCVLGDVGEIYRFLLAYSA